MPDSSVTKELEKVDERSLPPVVGERYLVPCVQIYKTAWPVTGPRHEDADIIGFVPQHWHYDLRFLTDDQMDQVCARRKYESIDILRKAFGAINCPDEDAHGYVLVKSEATVCYRELVCMREQPQYQVSGETDPGWIPALQDAFATATVKCGRCPHRGLPLESLPRVPDTNVVRCPGHGLCWDLDTGKLVRRKIEKTTSDETEVSL